MLCDISKGRGKTIGRLPKPSPLSKEAARYVVKVFDYIWHCTETKASSMTVNTEVENLRITQVKGQNRELQLPGQLQSIPHKRCSSQVLH